MTQSIMIEMQQILMGYNQKLLGLITKRTLKRNPQSKGCSGLNRGFPEQ